MKTTRTRPLAGAALAALLLVGAACGEDSDKADTGASGASPTSTASGTVDAATFSFVPLDAGGKLTKDNLSSGDIDIALLFSSDGAIAKNKWVALEDDKNLQPVDNFIPAIRTDKASGEGVAAVLDKLSSALTREKVQEMVAAVAIDGENPADVAKAFVADVDVAATPVSGDFKVGSANFAESEIVAQIYGQGLAKAGANVSYQLSIGSREAYLLLLENGGIDLVPEFVGTLSGFLGGAPTNELAPTVAEAKTLSEAKGFTLLEPAPADSVNTFVVTQATADKYSLKTVSDLAKVTDPLVLGGPPECPNRAPCLKGLQDVYGLKFKL